MAREVPTHYFYFQLFDEKLEIKKMESLWMEMASFQHEQTKNDINPCGSHAIILQRYAIMNFETVDC